MPGLNCRLSHLIQSFTICAALLGALCLGLWATPAAAQTPASIFQQRGLGRADNDQRAPRTEAALDAADQQAAGRQATDQQDDDAPQAENSPEHAERQAQAIVGAWLATGGDGSKGFITFHADGTLHGSIQGQVNAASPLGAFTDGHGVWRHLGGRHFGKVLVAIRYDPNTGQLKGFVKARTDLRINRAGNHMTATDKLEVLDPDGNVVFATAATGTFTRVKFEPFN